ncbi:MAG TPA: serine/threonine-protein kinase [Polyangia bacterium]|nr:serine/threonine-protein kinase [Polyangia bacterium]
MRNAFLYLQLVWPAIIFFNAVVYVLAGLRLKHERTRELNLAATFLFLGVHAVAFSRILQGAADAYWLRVAAACHYLIFLFLLRFVDTYRSQRSRLSLALHAVALGAVAANLLTDLPFVYRATGDLRFWIVGLVPRARMPIATAATHVAFASVIAVLCVTRALEAMRQGHRELRFALPLTAVGFPLFCLGVAAYVGLSPAPPPTGFLAAVVALFFTWRRFEQQAHRGPAAQRERADRIGQYRVLRPIGAGGMAEVVLAERAGPREFAKQVAIKRILPHLANQQKFVAMFIQEARLAARLSHPNIVQIHELGVEAGRFYIVMEYVHGANLHWLMEQWTARRQAFPPPLAAQIGLQVLAGLAYAHEFRGDKGRLGIVHRDVTPQNVLIGDSGIVKLGDFGVAYAADRLDRTATGVLKGNIAYTAPEYAAGEGLDARADLFALGVVLYELLCGVRPFDGPTHAATIRNIVDGKRMRPSERVPGLPAALEAVIWKAIERQPADRFQSAREMANALRVYLAEAGSVADGSALGRLVRAELAQAQAEAQAQAAQGRPSDAFVADR